MDQAGRRAPSPSPGPMPARLIQLSSFRARGGNAAINLDPFGGWGSAARGGVEVHDFACDHMEIFHEPRCRELSAALRDGLALAQQQLEEPERAAEFAELPAASPA